MIKLLLIITGSVALSLAVIGVFLPILPTTPLVLVAAACYAKGSRRMYRWIVSNKYFGPVVRDWETTRSITYKAKLVSLLFMNTSIIISMIITRNNLFITALLLASAVMANFVIGRIPVKKAN